MVQSFLRNSGQDALHHFFPTNAPRRNEFNGPIFLLVIAGQATVEIDNHPYIIRSGILLTLLPYHLLYTITNSQDFHCYIYAFTFSSMAEFPYLLHSCISEKIEQSPAIHLASKEQERLKCWYETLIHHVLLTEHPSYKEILRSLTFIFTAEVSAFYSDKSIKTSATHVEELAGGFFRLLHEGFRTNRELTFYADHLCISAKYLSRVIRKVTGQLPSFWIADFTMKEARSLLKSTTLTITQISERLNFPNSSFFARYFKRYAGIAPQEYRSSLCCVQHNGEYVV